MKKLLIASALLASTAFSGSAVADTAPNPKAVWGGGKKETSAYSGTYVPQVITVLESQRLAGYTWGGPTDGTVQNAEIVSENPTNLAVGQLDILRSLKDQPIPGKEGMKYSFTILKENLGPECLYAVTAEKNYSTLGDVIGNSWDLAVITGGKKSGSYGTWQVLTGIYPDLGDMQVTNTSDNLDLINQVATIPGTVGFFVMRPDPESKVFTAIADKKLSIIPVVDIGLENRYQFLDLKVEHGGLLSGAKTVTTACTSVALITGDPASAALKTPNEKKRLAATIERIGKADDSAFVPDTSSWRDMFDSIRSATSDKVKDLMEKSKTALEGALKKGQAG